MGAVFMETPREDYTWEMLTKDLALSTQLNFSEAFHLTYILKDELTIHPYDALSPLIKMCSFLMPTLGIIGAEKFAQNLLQLTKENHED